jgi:hypothetical protein
LKNRIQLAFIVPLLIGAGVPANAADLAVLRNGNSIRHERREVSGTVTRLYFTESSNGYVEIPNDQIERFEKDTTPPPMPAASSSNSLPAYKGAASASKQASQPELTREGLNQLVNGAGARHQIDPDFISSVIRAESGYHSRAVSKKGAQGLMQLMPGTASQLGVHDAFDPHANVEGGTKYLRELLEKYDFDVPKALAAYNAGSRPVEKYHGVPPYSETQAYVARIIRDFNRRKLAEDPSLAKKMKTTTASSSSRTTRKRRAAQKNPGANTAVKKGPETASR